VKRILDGLGLVAVVLMFILFVLLESR